MKKHHLVPVAMACAVAASLMVGAAYAPQEAYTSPMRVGSVIAVMEDIATSASDKASSLNARVVQAAEEQAVAQAAAEAQAQAQERSGTSKSNTATSDESNPNSSSANKPLTSKSACTITVDGISMNYTESYGASSAPDSGAGVWKGSDSTTDGSYGYFIGHNPGSFGSAATASNGSKVTVNDNNGDSRTYTVVDSFVVPRGSTWGDISDRVTGHGESVVLQTCVEDGYRVVIAE